MLINVVKTGEIVSLRLSTGEELVGTLREEDKNQITIGSTSKLFGI